MNGRHKNTYTSIYYVPHLKMEVKVESNGSTRNKIAHLPTGIEKVSKSEMDKDKWEFLRKDKNAIA